MFTWIPENYAGRFEASLCREGPCQEKKLSHYRTYPLADASRALVLMVKTRTFSRNLTIHIDHSRHIPPFQLQGQSTATACAGFIDSLQLCSRVHLVSRRTAILRIPKADGSSLI